MALEAAFVWSSALSPDGKTAYFGTGDQGRIFAVTLRQGNTAPAPRKLADLDVPWVTSLVVRPDGTLLAGSTPGGRVFAVDPGKGDVRTLRQAGRPSTSGPWSTTLPAGPPMPAPAGSARSSPSTPRGVFARFWDSGDKQVVSLLPMGGGALLAGTSDSGILYRVYGDGRAEAVHDFEAEEVRAILRVGNTTYVAVNDFSSQTGTGGGTGGTGGSATARQGDPHLARPAGLRRPRPSAAPPAPARPGGPSTG